MKILRLKVNLSSISATISTNKTYETNWSTFTSSRWVELKTDSWFTWRVRCAIMLQTKDAWKVHNVRSMNTAFLKTWYQWTWWHLHVQRICSRFFMFLISDWQKNSWARWALITRWQVGFSRASSRNLEVSSISNLLRDFQSKQSD